MINVLIKIINKILFLLFILYPFSVYADCKIVNLQEFEKLVEEKSPVTLIFFSTWCSDCIESLKATKKDESLNKNYIIVSTFNSDFKSANKVLADFGIDGLCILDKNSEIAKKYGIKSVPHKISISK
ncbi:TlpA family protein disulfide reductase [Silvanigrella aquatica]|uniref:Redoxin domain-containing protein n=1 Tax=Silvanigrella aquatica TaxID=1915309 RepID=A0A1L4D1A5_9BACT|nr:redoxin family protein [Silvanigrella aquatica]APJ03974.1 hypothetical protein AXG55_08660 [Silvanigrella aquatica]